jgi:hypothetical protein
MRAGLPGTLAVGLAAALLATGVAAERLPPPPEGWEPLPFRRIGRQTRYERAPDGDATALRAEARCSASALMHPLAAGQLERTPRLRWRWRVEQGLGDHDETVKTGDDFAARVYVLFRFDPSQASLWERARHRLARALREDAPGRAISYVWSSREPAGRSWESPYAVEARVVSLGRGPLPEWRSEQVDPRSDYRRLFGSEPPDAIAIALMTDSDDTCADAVAWFADFALASPDS